VLIGDALRTVHFSIGSGTRNALEDAIALFRAFEAHGGDVEAALAAFEAARRPGVEKFLAVAERSAAWYERFAEKLSLAPLPLAHDYLMRGGRITLERLRARSPRFAEAWERHEASQRQPAGGSR
jgi:2-polyprenyl-6-methoxyphenol hydroxylase-like FAD-dependent oxidoreductase